MRRRSQLLTVAATGSVAVVAMAAVVFLWAPGSGAQTAATQPADATVILHDYQFDPQVVRLPHENMTVTWEHRQGDVPHSITFDATDSSGAFDFPGPQCQSDGHGGAVSPADCFHQGQIGPVVTFKSGGAFKYHCKIHPAMVGEVDVAGPQPTIPGVTTTTTAVHTTTTKKTTDTTVGTLTSTTVADTSTSEASTTSSSSSTSSTINFTTQTTAPGQNALGKTSKNDDKPSGVLEAVGVILLAAAAAGLIPAWRRLA